MKKIRVSLVHYLNSAPLGWALLHGPLRERFEVIPSSPARCADQLAAGEVEIGLIPSVEYAQIPDLEIIPGMAIASLDEVRSILLVRPLGKERIDSVALDTTSRSSVVLTKILMKEIMGLRPEFVPHPPDISAMLARCDAALLIGDAALAVNLKDYHTMDLARMWVAWQKKPFVFAFWAARKTGTYPDDLVSLFREAKEWGLARRGEIAVRYAERLGLERDFLESYLLHNINYDLDPAHIQGLESYYGLAARGGYIKEAPPLRFMRSQETIGMR
jgi:chorismate dehydratase